MAAARADAGLRAEARAARVELATAARVVAMVLVAAVAVAETSQEGAGAGADKAVVAHLAAAEASGAVGWRAEGRREAEHAEAEEPAAGTRVVAVAVVAAAAWSCHLDTHSRRHQERRGSICTRCSGRGCRRSTCSRRLAARNRCCLEG